MFFVFSVEWSLECVLSLFSHRTLLYSNKVPLKHVGMFPDSATFNASQNNVLRRISLLKEISQLFIWSRWSVGEEDDIEGETQDPGDRNSESEIDTINIKTVSHHRLPLCLLFPVTPLQTRNCPSQYSIIKYCIWYQMIPNISWQKLSSKPCYFLFVMSDRQRVN